MPKKIHKTMWTDQEMNPCDVQWRLDGYIKMVQGKMDAYWKIMEFTHAAPDRIYAEFGKNYVDRPKDESL